MEKNPWQIRFERERLARKESELLLEEKSLELWKINQNLEFQVNERTESLKNALAKAEKADKAKSDFLANISHEIRTPLNAIIGFSEHLTKSEELNEQNKKFASIIQSSANSLLSIINDILDFSKIESGNFEVYKDDFNIQDICNHVVELFSHRASEKNINFSYFFDTKIPKFIITDGLRIKQVLSNLISNAIKFTPEYGNIDFDVTLVNKNYKNAFIRFEVKDSGIGIPEDKIEQILSPFIQLENIANKHNIGTGLGLSICNNILKLLDSKIEIESKLEKGSIFSFCLNSEISDSLSFKEENKEIKKDEEVVFLGKILLVEDNLLNQKLMQLILKKLHLEFEIASNGQEALDIYYKKYREFNLILMDINMPVLNGVEAFYQIRNFEEENFLREIPIIALTANAIKGDRERYIELGMNDYLSKPVDKDELKRVISEYLFIEAKEIQSQQKNDNYCSIEKNHKINIEKICNKIGISENIANLLVNKFKKEIFDDLKELEKHILDDDFEKLSSKIDYIKNLCLNISLDDEATILEEINSKELSKQLKIEKFNSLTYILKSL